MKEHTIHRLGPGVLTSVFHAHQVGFALLLQELVVSLSLVSHVLPVTDAQTV